MNVTQQIYQAIVDHHRRFGQVPLREELQKNFCHDAADAVDPHLATLARDGLIVLEKSRGGRISLSGPARRTATRLGIQGFRAARPAEAGTEPGTLALDLGGIGLRLGDDAHALQVRDDSMCDAGVLPGDIAILKPGVPLSGEIVAAMAGEHTVLRRFLVIRGIPHLLAENRARPELYAAYDIQFHGVLRALLRTEFGGPGHACIRLETVSYLDGALPARRAASRPAPANRRGWPPAPQGIALNEPAAGFGTKSKNKRRTHGRGK